MALRCEKARAKTFCLLEQAVFVLLNDKSRMKGDFHVRFCEKFEVKLLDIVNITLHFFLKDVRSMLPPAVNHSIAVS